MVWEKAGTGRCGIEWWKWDGTAGVVEAEWEGKQCHYGAVRFTYASQHNER